MSKVELHLFASEESAAAAGMTVDNQTVFTNLSDIVTVVDTANDATVTYSINIHDNCTFTSTEFVNPTFAGLEFVTENPAGVTLESAKDGQYLVVVPGGSQNVVIGEGVTLFIKQDELSNYYGNDNLDIYGNFKTTGPWVGCLYTYESNPTVRATGSVDTGRIQFYPNFNAEGVSEINGETVSRYDAATPVADRENAQVTANWLIMDDRRAQQNVNFSDTYVKIGTYTDNYYKNASTGHVSNIDSTKAEISSLSLANSTFNVNDGSYVDAVNATIGANGVVNIEDSTFASTAITNNGAVNVGGESSLNLTTLTGNAVNVKAGTTLKDSTIGGAVEFADGDITLAGKVAISGNLNGSSYAETPAESSTVTIGEGAEVTLGNTYVGNDISDASITETWDVDDATVKFGGLYARESSIVDIDNSNVTLGNANIKGKVTITDSVLTFNESLILDSKADFGATANDPALFRLENTDWSMSGNYNISLGKSDGSRFGALEIYNSDVNHKGVGMTINQGSSLKIEGDSDVVIDHVYDYTSNITNNGTILMDSTATLTVDTLTGNGTITVDASGFAGYSKIIDLNGTESLEGKVNVINGDSTLQVHYGADGDVSLVNAGTDRLYVNSAWNSEADLSQLEKDAGFIYGINAFTKSQAAMEAAKLNGGATINVDGMGEDIKDTNTVKLNVAGDYVIEGGNGRNSSLYGASLTAGDVSLTFQDASFKVGKFYAQNLGSSLTINNSVIGRASAGGHGGGWFTAQHGTIAINNSILGINFDAYTDEQLAALPRSADKADKANLAPYGQNLNGQHIGTLNKFEATDSTVYTGWISVIDRGLMELDNSILYYGGTISIGAGRVDTKYASGAYSNSNGWDYYYWGTGSAAGFREGEVATMNITDSIVRNIGEGNGTSGMGGGAVVQVGGTDPIKNQAFSGVLNIKNSDVSLTGEGPASESDRKSHSILDVAEGSAVNITDSRFEAAKVVLNGEFNVYGESTLKIDNLSGYAFIHDGAVITDSTIAAGGNVCTFGTNRWEGTNTIGGIFSVGYTSFDELPGDINTTVVGNFSSGNTLLWNGSADHTTVLNIGEANADRTIYTGGQIGVFDRSTVNVTNADVVYNYIFERAAMNVDNSTLTIKGGTDTFFSGNAVVVVNNSTWNSAAFTYLGGYGVNYSLGNTDMTIKGGSTFNAGNLRLLNNANGTNAVKLTVDNATVNAKTSFMVDKGSEVLLTANGILNSTGKLTNNGSITIDCSSLLKGTSLTGDGTITIDAAGFTGVQKVIDLNGTESLEGKVEVIGGDDVSVFYGEDGDVTISNTDMSTIYLNSTWEGDLGDTVAEGKFLGINAFTNMEDAASVIPGNVNNIVFTAGNEVSYGDLSVDQDVVLSTSGRGEAVLSKFNTSNSEGEANTVTIAEGSSILITGGGALHSNDTIIVNGNLSFDTRAAGGDMNIYGKSDITVNETGTLHFKSYAMQNTINPITVYGTMVIGDAQEDASSWNGWAIGSYPKIAGNENNVGSLIVDGSKGKGTLEIYAPAFSIGGGYASSWVDNGKEASVTLTNGAALTTNAWMFRIGTGGSLTVEAGSSFIVLDNSKYAGMKLLGSGATVYAAGNDGEIAISNSTFDISNLKVDFTNNGTISAANGDITFNSLVNNSEITLAGDSTLAYTTLNNQGAINVDATGLTGDYYKVIDSAANDATIAGIGDLALTGNDDLAYTLIEYKGDIYTADIDDVYVNSAWATGYAYGDMIETGKYYGINAFGNFTEAQVRTAGSRVFHLANEAGTEGILSVTFNGEGGNGATINVGGNGLNASQTITADGTFSQMFDVKADANNGEFIFTVNGDGADYIVNAVFNKPNNPDVPVVVPDLEDGQNTVAEDGLVSTESNAATYTFTAAPKELSAYVFHLENLDNSTVYVEIFDSVTGNRIFNSSSSKDIQRTLPTLADGSDYTIKVSVPDSINNSYLTRYNAYITKEDLLNDGKGGSSAAYIRDEDNTRSGANAAATSITDWVGALDNTDWYKLDMSSFAADGSVKATFGAEGAGVRATVVKVSGGVETTVANLYTSNETERTFAYDGTSDYFVKFANTSSNSAKSVYSMSIASA